MINGPTYAALEKRVKKGVLFLDRREPKWFTRIDLNRLNLGDGAICIIGQLFTDYVYGQEELKKNDTWMIAHGFYLPNSDVNHYDLLTRAWWPEVYKKQEAEARRSFAKRKRATR